MIALGGLTPFTTVDYPGLHAAVVFCQGCPWRCPYCHNPHLQPLRQATEALMTWEDAVRFLQKRRGLLDAVVFSGGEPLQQPALPEAIQHVRELGFRIGLHTGGSHPKRLQSILPLVNWIGFDVKAPWNDYALITGVDGSGAAARESLMTILRSGTPCEVRTTLHPKLLSDEALRHMGSELEALGISRWTRQAFRRQGCAHPTLTED